MTGTEYLKAIQAYQDGCQAATQERLGTIDSKLPDTLEALGETLLLLRQYGSCNWGCRGGAHLMERFSARTVSYAGASLRLMWIGHYDEAYVLIRNLGELANLFSYLPATQSSLRHGAMPMKRSEEMASVQGL